MNLHLTLPRRAVLPLLFSALLSAATLASAQDETLNTIPLPAVADDSPVVVPPQAPAPEPVVEIQEIEVTGSRIRRTDYETATPLISLSRKDIEQTGLTSIGDILQSLSSAGSALGTTFNNGGTGATEVDLRNLGSNRVLVLVNGHRWVNGLRSLSTSAVDLNTIPISIIERVEILKDGASAVYGSDAIAGVVNVITRKNADGLTLSTQVGSFLEGDGAQQEHNAAYGRVFDSDWGQTRLFGNVGFRDQRPVFAKDRAISALPKIDTGLTRASSFLPEGRFLFVPTQANGLLLGTGRCGGLAGDVAAGTVDAQLGAGSTPQEVIDFGNELPGVQLCDLIHIAGRGNDSPTADFRRFQDPNDRYNFATTNYLSTPLRNYSAYLAGGHTFSSFIKADFELLYSRRESRQEIAPQPICVGNLCPVIGGLIPGQPISYNQATYVPANSPFNPFGQDIGRLDPNDPGNTTPPCPPLSDPAGAGVCAPVLGLSGQGAILRRMQDFGPRIQEQIVPTMFGYLSLNGDFEIPERFKQFTLLDFSNFHWEVGYGYGQTEQDETLFNQINMRNLQLALGPAGACAADPGCVPVNFFGGQGSMTPAMLGYLGFDAITRTQQTQSNLIGNIAFNIDHVLAAGPIGIAFGAEMREDEYSFLPDARSIDGTTSGLVSQPTQGMVKATEYFGEISLPLLSDYPFVNELELSLAGRVSQYETFGDSSNYKIGLRYKPLPDLLLRSTYATSFKAPDVGSLFLGLSDSFPALADPCATGDGSPRTPGSNTETNCEADGVGEITQMFAQTLAPFGGNPDLKPETSKSVTAGVVWSPELVPGLDFGIDYYNIEVENFIDAFDPQTDILDACYNVAPDARTNCEFISRNPANQQLQRVLTLFSNFPRIETEGFDINLGYTLPSLIAPEVLGEFRIATDASFLSSYNKFTKSADGSTNKQGFAGTFPGVQASIYPRWKINPSLQWRKGDFKASWNSRIVWRVQEDCFDGIPPSLAELGVCSDPNNAAGPKNEIETGVVHNFQFGWSVPERKAEMILGVQNVFNTDPPISYSAFANSFVSSDYWVPGVMPYLRLKKSF